MINKLRRFKLILLLIIVSASIQAQDKSLNIVTDDEPAPVEHPNFYQRYIKPHTIGLNIGANIHTAKFYRDGYVRIPELNDSIKYTLSVNEGIVVGLFVKPLPINKYIDFSIGIDYYNNPLDIDSLRSQLENSKYGGQIKKLEISRKQFDYVSLSLKPNFHYPWKRLTFGIQPGVGISYLKSPKLDIELDTKGFPPFLPAQSFKLLVDEAQKFNLSLSFEANVRYQLNQHFAVGLQGGLYSCLTVFKDVTTSSQEEGQEPSVSSEDLRVPFSVLPLTLTLLYSW